jgi:hypothetical protein
MVYNLYGLNEEEEIGIIELTLKEKINLINFTAN